MEIGGREYVRKGAYLVPKNDLERAQEAFDKRSRRSRAVDKSLRGPITSDVDRYIDSQGRVFDYPGVDTPTESPSRAAEDFPFPDERREMARGGSPNGMIIDDTPGEVSLSGVFEDMGTQGRSMLNAFFGKE